MLLRSRRRVIRVSILRRYGTGHETDEDSGDAF